MARILIAEDDILNAKLLGYIVGSEGHEVVHAEDGLAALDAAKRFRFDLIFMDIQMPGMDGLNVLKRLKTDPATSGIPVIAVTASVMGNNDREFYLNLGFSDYVLKPIYLANMKKIMGRYLGIQDNI